MFYDLFFQLCVKKRVTPSKACLDMGLSRSLAAKWKNTKAMPSAEVLAKVAAYFRVSTDYLLGKEDNKKTPPAEAEGVSDDDIKIALFGGAGEVTDAMWDEAMFAVELIKERHKRKKDDK